MAIRSTADARAELRGRAANDRLVVVCLCAAWCETCREFRTTYHAIAAADQATLYVWLDIEDDEALVGDLEVETFPTLAIYRGERLMHFGASLPQSDNVARLITAAAERANSVREAPQQLVALGRWLTATEG